MSTAHGSVVPPFSQPSSNRAAAGARYHGTGDPVPTVAAAKTTTEGDRHLHTASVGHNSTAVNAWLLGAAPAPQPLPATAQEAMSLRLRLRQLQMATSSAARVGTKQYHPYQRRGAAASAPTGYSPTGSARGGRAADQELPGMPAISSPSARWKPLIRRQSTYPKLHV